MSVKKPPPRDSFSLAGFDKIRQEHSVDGMAADKPVTTMNISLPKPMRAFVQERVAEGGYSSVSEYFRELVRKDEQTKAQDRLDRLLLEGVRSGRSAAMTRE